MPFTFLLLFSAHLSLEKHQNKKSTWKQENEVISIGDESKEIYEQFVKTVLKKKDHRLKLFLFYSTRKIGIKTALSPT